MTAALGTREERTHGYETARPDVQALVPATAARILDLGCASGALGEALKRTRPAYVVGVELDPEYARDAATRLDRVVTGDVSEAIDGLDPAEPFDCIVAADVLEHLVDPWDVLRRAADRLQPGGTVVVSVPNVRQWQTFVALLVHGRWPRLPSGLFDATHLRWFTLRDARELLEQAGLEVVSVEPKLWFQGPVLKVMRLVARTPLAPFVTGQYLLAGVKRG